VRLLVLGHRGMLGHVAARRFAELGHDVHTIDARFDPLVPGPFLDACRASDAAAVVNAIGLIKQRSADPLALMDYNAVLPALLRAALAPEVLLVQPSTDCVFDGSRGWRARDERPDATDAYGYSKAVGEGVARCPNTTVVRASIVGPERPGVEARGLLGWFLGRPRGSTVPGFTDHLWNGLTTLEWCEVVAELLADLAAGRAVPGLVQPGVERRWSKAEMLDLFRDELRPDLRIERTASGNPTDRTLAPDRVRADFAVQVRALARWARGA
jgi:dTDP-4-dehydrorhamnose reductase